MTIEGRDKVEVGYGLMPEFWGPGLAVELTRESLRVGFMVVGLREIVAFTLVDNRRSRRVMEKAGFQYERAFEYANLPHVLYRVQNPVTA